MNDTPPEVQQSPPKKKPNRGKKGGTGDKDFVSFRVSPEQRAALDERAAASGVSRSAYARAKTVADIDGPAARRQLPVDRALLIKINANWGRIGGNLNQLAYQANIGNFPAEGEIRAVLAELLRLMNENRAALGQQVLP